jgi:hypothetical protein
MMCLSRQPQSFPKQQVHQCSTANATASHNECFSVGWAVIFPLFNVLL